MSRPALEELPEELSSAIAEGSRYGLASSHITQSRSPRVRIFFGLSTGFHLLALVALWWLWTGKSEKPEVATSEEAPPRVSVAQRAPQVVRIHLGDAISLPESLSIEAITQQLAKIRAEAKVSSPSNQR